ncbi:MAG: ABC transporter permease [Verrucomicrobiota bacterium]|jgi:predicted permease
MKTLRTIWKEIRSLCRRRAVKREIDEELRFHLEQRAADNLAAGMSPEEAGRAARRRFGNVQSIREGCRDVRGASLGETTLQDIRFGLRMLRKNPGFTAVAVLSLALGIGVNTGIFSLLNAVLLRSLPVRNPHELRVINWVGRSPELHNFSSSSAMGRLPTGLTYSGTFPYPAYRDFRDRGTGFAEVFAFSPLYGVTMVARGDASTTGGLLVSGNFFTGYGAQTLLGRPITAGDDQPGAPPVTLITYRLWERQFGLDPNVLGQTVTLNKNAFTIIGVLPRDFVGPFPGDPADFYAPLSAQPQLAPNFPLTSPSHWWVDIMARLAPHANEAQAQASLEVFFRQALRASDSRIEQPGIWLADGRRGPSNIIRQRAALPLWGLQASVGLVLLIACANLASLLLARGAARQHEMAVRAAIGAGRWRLVRQLLTESLVLSLAGGGLGLLFAWWAKAVLLSFLSGFQDIFHFDARTDTHVLLFTLGLSVATALLFGLLPAVRAACVDPAAGLKDRAALGAPRLRLAKVLVSLQVGLSVLLVVLAGLVIQTFANLSRTNPGFNPENLLLFRLNAAQPGREGQRLLNLYENLRQSIAAIPGVRAVAFSDVALIAGSESLSGISIPGRPANPNQPLQAWQMVVSDAFFSTMGMNLLLGRDFDPADTGASPKVAVVNETFARSFFPGESPLGRSFTLGGADCQIVGVCRDAKYAELRKDAPPTMYLCCRQTSVGGMYFEVRSVLPPLSLVPAVRQAVAAFAPDLPLAEIKTQRQQIDRSIAPERLLLSLSCFLALLALLLSCIGLYGLMAYQVARRTAEIAIRMALGARPQDVARPIVRDAALLAATGVAFGLPVAFGLTHLVRAVLYGVQPYDPATLIGSAVLLLCVAALAAWIPARRAARVNPMTALRYE